MRAQEFKTIVTEVKDLLKGKTLTLEFMNQKGRVKKVSYTSLRAFGIAVLKLEEIGAGFSVVKVSNDLVEKGIYKPSQFPKVLKRGVWNEIFFYASTVK